MDKDYITQAMQAGFFFQEGDSFGFRNFKAAFLWMQEEFVSFKTKTSWNYTTKFGKVIIIILI